MPTQLATYCGIALLLATLNTQLTTLHAQGNLTPPGAPAPTMKSLAQIEPRTPISSVPFIISVPGSYYLTTNLISTVSNAIVIAASGVTLDLNGFTIFSTVANAANGGSAILLNGGLSDITISNGHIRGGVTNNGSGIYSGSGFSSGIYYSASPPLNARVSGVSVSGCLNYGIFLYSGNSLVVEACTVRTLGQFGIVASTIKNSTAADCGSYAVYGDQVSNCWGESTGNGAGIFCNTALNCYGSSSNYYGIYATSAQNCYGSSGSSGGIYANSAQNCYGTSASGSGLNVNAAINCYAYCNGTASAALSATTAENCHAHNGGSGFGLFAVTALGCYGDSSSGTGLYASTAQNCYGASTSGNGLWAVYLASACFGSSSTGIGLHSLNASYCTGARGGGTAIQATIGTGCFAYNGTNSITYKYNMP